MNKDYLQAAHTKLGVNVEFEEWAGKIKNNDDYLSQMHAKLGVTKDFSEWKGKVVGASTPSVPSDYKPAATDFTGWNVTEMVDGVSMSLFTDPDGNNVKDEDVPPELMKKYLASEHEKAQPGEATSFSQFVFSDTKGGDDDQNLIGKVDSHKLLGEEKEKVKNQNKVNLENYYKLVEQRKKLDLSIEKQTELYNNNTPDPTSNINFSSMRMVDPSAGEVTGNVNNTSNQLGGSNTNYGRKEAEKQRLILEQEQNENRKSLVDEIDGNRITRIVQEIAAGKHGEMSIVDVMTKEDASAHFKRSVEDHLEENQALLQLNNPESQQLSKKKTNEQLEENIPNLDFDPTKVESADNKNVAPKTVEFKKEFEAKTLQLENLEKEKNALGEVDGSSDPALVAQWNVINDKQNILIGDQKSIQGKQEKLFADNATMTADYKKAYNDIQLFQKDYKNRIVLASELGANAEDLFAYQNLIKRNNHNVVAGGAWLVNGTVSLGTGLEGAINAVKELPEDLLFEYYDNDYSKMPNIVKGLKGLDVVTDTMRMAGKEKVANFMNSLNDSVQEVKDFDDIDNASDLGVFALHGLANFAPQLGLMAVTGGASIYVMGASAFGNKFDEMERSNLHEGTQYSLGEKWLASTITGGSEVLSEKVTFNLFKGVGKTMATKIKQRGFKSAMQNFSIGGTMKAVSGTAMESGSEVLAQLGGNIADKFVLGKDISITDGMKGAAFTGLIMERAMSMPAVYHKLSPIFMGKDYTERFADLNKQQKDLGDRIVDPSTTSLVRDKFETKWLKIQEQKERLMAENFENIDQMKGEEKNRLVNIENSLHNLRKEEENINNDKTIPQADKETLIEDLYKEQQELKTERNKIAQKYESQETREERVTK